MPKNPATLGSSDDGSYSSYECSSSSSSSSDDDSQPKKKQDKKNKKKDDDDDSSDSNEEENNNDPAADDDPFANGDPSKWIVTESTFNGNFSYETIGKTEKIKGKSISRGIEEFKANPTKYVAIMYQTSMTGWAFHKQSYEFIHREGTLDWQPADCSDDGWMTVLTQRYERLPPFPENKFPVECRDKYTDTVLNVFGNFKIHHAKNKPLLPGRSMGVVDAPNLKIIGDVDPSDIEQGQVGNCWMLSGISSLAEFDGAVKRLFRKTPNLDEMPRDEPNVYTVTLWDLKTWTEVDIVVDERLCATPDGSGKLLSSKPSVDGELWVCYLEKALAAHCGGWNKIVGGQCTHAWALMTGCKHQYTIQKTDPDDPDSLYYCAGKFNPYKQKWARHANSPHDCDGTMWSMPWPEVGGGGTDELTKHELFERMCAWDDVNYIVAAGSSAECQSSTGEEGMVDNHAYSVIEAHANVAGTDVDLIKVRNPWGRGEIEDGEFDDDGPGWDAYPQIKAELNPVVADDGIFWVTKDEFFDFFQVIYLSASNMTEFLED